MNNNLNVSIRRLRTLSVFLFIFSNVAIFGTLLFQNYLTSAKYNYYKFHPSLLKETKIEIACNENNNYCYSTFWKVKTKKLGDCLKTYTNRIYTVGKTITVDGDENYQTLIFDKNKTIRTEFQNTKIIVNISKSKKKDLRCIKNYPIAYSIYKFLPQIPSSIVHLKLSSKYFDPTGKVVNPFIYGETSISNIAKRYPLYLIFKPLLFIASILMVLYWIYTRKVISFFNKNKNLDSYFIFGVFSGVFLFLHVLFLGSEFNNEFLNKIRRFYIIFFILFELTAQYLLIKRLFELKISIINYINPLFLFIKRFFVISFLTITIIILFILSIYNLPKNVDYVIEWNYFVILSIYYLFTYFLWRRSL